MNNIIAVKRDAHGAHVINYYIGGKYRMTSAPRYIIFRIGDYIHIFGVFFGRFRHKKTRYTGNR